MSDGHMRDIVDREVLAIFFDEVVEFLQDLAGDTSVSLVSERIKHLDISSRLVGARVIAKSTSDALAAIATATCIDFRVVNAVRELTLEIVWEARDASSLLGVEFTGEAVELKVAEAEKPAWWRVW